MRHILLVLGLIVFVSPRVAAEDGVAMRYTAIADPGKGWVYGLDISGSGDRVLFVKCDRHDWWSFIPVRLQRLLDDFSRCNNKTLVVVDETGKSIATMSFGGDYHDAHFVDRDTIAFSGENCCHIMVAMVSPDGVIRISGKRDIPQSFLHSNLRLSATWLGGQIYTAIEHPAGHLTVESMSGDDRHILDGLDVRKINDIGLAHDIIWFRAAIEHDVLGAYRGPAKIIADYPFPGGGGPGVDEVLGFAAFGPDADAISAQIMRNFTDIDGALPWMQLKRGYSKYAIRDVSPGGTVLTTMGEKHFYIFKREGASYRRLVVDRPSDLFAAAVSNNGRVVALEPDMDGRKIIKLGIPAD